MVRIWDAATGCNVLDLPLLGSTVSQFSPDGRWLVTMCGDDCQFWEVGTWRKGVLIHGFTVTFTPDSALAAVADSQGSVRLVEPDTGRETLRLTSPEPAEYTQLCFTADGSRLIAASSMDQGLHVWDLRLIRGGLLDLGLGKDWPPALSFGEKASHPELDVTVDAGPLRGPVSLDDRLCVAVHTLQLATFPLNAEAYYQRGRAYGRLLESGRAIADYSAYLMLSGADDPRLPDVLLRRAGNLQKQKDYGGALADLKRLTQLGGDAFSPPDTVAELLNQVARHYIIPTPSAVTNVVALAEKAVRLEPFNSYYQNTLGGALYRAGRYAEAIHCLEANALSNGTSAGLDWYFLALCHERQGHGDKAHECLARAESWKQKTADLSATEMAEVTALQSEAALLCHGLHQER
jgi:tetratricopeptide (TPR) repeat protein